jgi:hypothetical protein
MAGWLLTLLKKRIQWHIVPRLRHMAAACRARPVADCATCTILPHIIANSAIYGTSAPACYMPVAHFATSMAHDICHMPHDRYANLHAHMPHARNAIAARWHMPHAQMPHDTCHATRPMAHGTWHMAHARMFTWHMAHARMFTCSHGTCTNATCKMAHAIIRAHGARPMAHAHEHEHIMHKCHTPRHMPHKHQHGTSNVTWQMPRHTRPHNANTPHASCKMAECNMQDGTRPMATYAHIAQMPRAQILPHAHLTHANAHGTKIKCRNVNPHIVLCQMPHANRTCSHRSIVAGRKLPPGTFPGTFPTELQQKYSRSSCAARGAF